MDRPMQQCQCGPYMVGCYRDTFRLLLQDAQRRLGKAALEPTVPDLDTPLVGPSWIIWSAIARTARVAARCGSPPSTRFFRYGALHAPEHSAVAQRVPVMPSNRNSRGPIAFLTSVDVDALPAAPDLANWAGRRDRAILIAGCPDRTARRGGYLTSLRGHRARRRRTRAMATARAARVVAPRWARMRLASCEVGCASATVGPTNRSSRPPAAPP